IDPLTLERDTPNHVGRSEVQRLRVARLRRTRDDRRATPNPMELDFVASGRGWQSLRRPVAAMSPRQGGRIGGVPSLEGSSPGADAGELPLLNPGSESPGGEARPAQGTDATRGREHRASAAVVTARPSVPRDRASVPALQRDRPSDTVDSRQRVAARVEALMQASTLGGEAARGVGGESAPMAPALGGQVGTGSRSAPSGVGTGTEPDLAADPGLQGFYRGVLSRLDQALRDSFPRWAIAEGLGGLVVFDLTLLEDGRVAHVSVVRPSGIAEYDRNVVASVRGIGTFGPVPHQFGSRAVLRINWDSLNPVVGRHGPGPGKRP
ncbi:MAG TPA: energy transducer TonB, partial [Polyangiaceae bacterium]